VQYQDKMDLTETSLKLQTTPFSINDILTSNNSHQSISKKIKQFCRFRRSSLDCFVVSKDDEQQHHHHDKRDSEKNIVQLLNSNPIDMRRRHNMSGKYGNDLPPSDSSKCMEIAIRLMIGTRIHTHV
jgi:hypothetical protein